MIAPRQGLIGVSLAMLLIGAWLLLHVWAVLFFSPEGLEWAGAPLLIAVICWLNVGLFIVSHDAMHGSLAPGRPAVNRWFGRVALLLYAGFSYDALRPKHFEHHRTPGTADDPDFSAAHPTDFRRWYLEFLHQYFGLRELMILTVVVAAYLLLLGAMYVNLLLFWALPAILSSLQLFYFGTYLPHRQEDAPFADSHRARSSSFSWIASLLTCFHFGYHHEHHLAPGVPWWRLPEERRTRSLAR